METHPKGSRARILLSSVFGPYAQDDEFGSRSINPMELYHNQVTRAQGSFSLRMFHRSWGIMLIQANISAPCTVPDFPTRKTFTRCRLRDAALFYQQPLHNLRMVTPRAESSPSNCATAGEVSRSAGTMTAHSRFSRNSFDVICHCPKDNDFVSPIWTMDQCRTSANAAASSGNGPDSMKWLFPCTRIPTMRFQASRL